MKKYCFFIALLWSGLSHAQKRESGNLVLENIPEPSAQMLEKLDQYQNVRTAAFADWDAEGKGILISTRFGNVAQIHHVGQPGGYRQQITFENEPISGAAVCPDAAKQGFIFSRDVGGNENFQLYYFDQQTGRKQLLTDGKSRHGGARWNDKGDKFAYTSNRRSTGDLDIYVASLANPAEAKMVFQGKGGGWGVADWSMDNSKMLVLEYISVNESKMYVLETATGKLDPINLSAKQIAYGGGGFSKDGKGVFLISDEDTEFQQLRFYDLATKKTVSLTPKINWDVEDFEQTEDGKLLVFSTNEGGYSKLYALDTGKLTYAPIAGLPKGVIRNFGFDSSGSRLAMTVNTPTIPGDVFVLTLRTKAVERWTFSEIGGLNAANFTEPTLVEYPTFDKANGKTRLIPAFLYTPKNASGKLPVVVSIHGGPEGQSLPTFSSQIQFWANEMKIAVLVPNVRGSTGYGKTYVKLDNGFLRENSVKDIGTLLDWVQKQPNLDAGRVAVFGGSYGGYMSLASMTNYNARFKCGIDLFGISNFVTFLKNTSAYRQDLRRVEYGDERDPKMNAHQLKISPLTNIKNITKPMFIYQGKNDPRVPLSESEQMVDALKQNQVPLWYVMAKDEGHGITKKANRDQVNAAIAEFLEKHLIGEPPK